VNHQILIPKPRARIRSLLCCSGGGVPACFFTLGAMQRQIETGVFYEHDVISSASGSTLVCALVERCYDLRYVDPSSPEWFVTHVVRPIHRFFGEQTLSGMWVEHAAWTLVDARLFPTSIDDLIRLLARAVFGDTTDAEEARSRRRASTVVVAKPLFCYNYVNVDSGFVTYDMSDIPLSDPLRTVKVILRCILPATAINGVNAADAGFKGNQYGTNVLYEYNPRSLTLITIKNVYRYSTYPSRSRIQSFFARSDIGSDITGDVSSVLICDPDVTPHETLMCTISNGLFESPDPYHRGAFYDYSGYQSMSLSWIYFTHFDVCKVLQNEGYIQMTAELKSNVKPRQTATKKSRIPNRDVHTTEVKAILRRHGYVDSRT
jgi:hypothetical protein